MKRKKEIWTAATMGRKGGKNGTGKAKARTHEQARHAARCRWDKQYREMFKYEIELVEGTCIDCNLIQRRKTKKKKEGYKNDDREHSVDNV